MKLSFATFATLAVHLAAASPAVDTTTKRVILDVVNTQLAPDGVTRNVVTANGQYPGPPITATKGQTLSVTVNNKLTLTNMRVSTSLGLDGLFVNTRNAFFEGTPFVNTCPLPPNTSFTYEYPLNQQTGTFWYHSELGVQYTDGFRGPLVVYDPLDPHAHLYDVDDLSTIIQLGDWWQTESLTLLAGYVATGVVPVSDTGTVNGAGRFNGGPEVPWSVINVAQGRRYRFRVINESVRNVFTFSIDSHTMTVIEADGVETQPLEIDSMQMLAGQRYSVVVKADQPVANYWINAPFTGGNPAVNPHQNGTLSRAILRYKGAPAADPTTPLTSGPSNNPLIEANLRPPEPDVILTLNLVVTAGKAIWNVNNVSYVSPTVPTLAKVLAGPVDATTFDVTENTFILPANKTVQIVFPETDDDDAHPFHLHGNNFWLIKSQTSPDENTINPIRRDIAGVGGTGTTIRFRTDNPGPWFFHCHIFWHKQAGLATVMLQDPDTVNAETVPNAAWDALCPAYNNLPEDQK
ncbi:multicopper oxidase [Amanita thiersii Skay4041]|uniref:Multicopper oxidase n=1 Tax=Amanita thiersii Skay4041 TaxID=703135 RepID=A0A2A9NCQ9_9AGAR|nr:multicopper oxidase [Amanita thiersii Skay4041]